MKNEKIPTLKPGDDCLAVSRAGNRIHLRAVRVSRVYVSFAGSTRVEGIDLKGKRPGKFVGDRRQCLSLAGLLSDTAPACVPLSKTRAAGAEIFPS